MPLLRLDIYVDDGCRGCHDAEALAAEAAAWFPQLMVDIHHLPAGQPLPEGVVAVPAFVLGGTVVQYGTPERGQLGRAVVDALLAARSTPDE